MAHYSHRFWHFTSLSRNCLFDGINSLQCYELTRRCRPLHLMLISPLTFAVHPCHEAILVTAFWLFSFSGYIEQFVRRQRPMNGTLSFSCRFRVGIPWGGHDTQTLPYAKDFIWRFYTHKLQGRKGFGRWFFYSSHTFSMVSVGLTLRTSYATHMVPLEMTHNHQRHSIQNPSSFSYH